MQENAQSPVPDRQIYDVFVGDCDGEGFIVKITTCDWLIFVSFFVWVASVCVVAL